eukprot:199804_1
MGQDTATQPMTQQVVMGFIPGSFVVRQARGGFTSVSILPRWTPLTLQPTPELSKLGVTSDTISNIVDGINDSARTAYQPGMRVGPCRKQVLGWTLFLFGIFLFFVCHISSSAVGEGTNLWVAQIFFVVGRLIGVMIGLTGMAVLIIWTRQRNRKYSAAITAISNYITNTLQNANNGYIVSMNQQERVNFNFIGA